MFAIISEDGRQYRVAKGEVIRFDRMKAEPGESFETSQVLAISDEENNLRIGNPILEGAKVEGTVIEHGKDKKIIVFKRKRRKTYRRKYGHRQDHTMVKIDKISPKSPSAKKALQEKTIIDNSESPKTLVKKAATKKAKTKKTAINKTKEDKPTT
ncbi:MAG: 50S ribosomal protein L21 [Deltaproteobacteria bacterium]|nr:50S ribosomal protein L21 [Deltaproteobacteria bacterium]